MNEINQREEELGRVRSNLVEMQEENKTLTVTREKFKSQNIFLTYDYLEQAEANKKKINRSLISKQPYQLSQKLLIMDPHMEKIFDAPVKDRAQSLSHGTLKS